MEVLREYHEGIIALSACLAGIVPEYIQKGLYEDAKLKALELEEVLAKEISSWSFRIMAFRRRKRSIKVFCG